jgi:SHS2 domain-containing protein
VAFETFEHTADIGLRVAAPNLPQLFVEAGRAVASLIIENPDEIELRLHTTIDLEAESVETLFIDWLRELIYRFETEHLLLWEFSIEIDRGSRRLWAGCRGESADWTRHLPDHELKAVTYHQLRVAETPEGWEAEVIFDI